MVNESPLRCSQRPRVPQKIGYVAGVPYYGDAPALDKVAAIKAPLLIVFAENYPGAQHGFNNDTTPRFDDKAAWQRTLALFNSTLRG